MTTTTHIPTVDFLGCAARILASGGDLGLVEMDVPPHHVPPLHVHVNADEGFYVMEGEVTLYVEGRAPVLVGPGEFFLAPRGVAHSYESGDATARVLVTSTPGGFERFVADVAALEELDPAVLGAVAASYGIEILGPPGARPL